MKPLLASLVLVAASLAIAADEPVNKSDEAAPKPDAKETMKALMLEDAKRKAAEAAKNPAAAAATPLSKGKDDINPLAGSSAPAPSEPKPAEKPAEKNPPAKDDSAKSVAAQPASVLPKVEVKKARITVLDVQLAQQQQEIAREQKLTKPTELDKALNDSKVSQKLSALGGQSADYRAGLAKERVSMMQDESDLIEAIAHAKTKEERAELQKQLDELRAFRRDLEKNMR
jgi:hypothetical protein